MPEFDTLKPQSFHVTTHSRISIRPVTALTGHTAGVRSVRFSPDGYLVASADGHALRLWEEEDGTWTLRHLLEVPAEILAFSPDGHTFAFSERFGGVQVWSREGNFIVELFNKEHEGLDVAFSADGLLLATADNQGRVLLWDTRTYDLCYTLQIAPDEQTGFPLLPVYYLSFSPDGTRLAFAYCSQERKVQVWALDQPASGALEPRLEWTSPITTQNEVIHDVAFSPDGQVLAVATGTSRCVWLFDAHAFTLVGKLPLPEPDNIPVVLAFSPGGRFLAVAAEDGVVWIWAVASQQLVTSFEAHTGRRVGETFAIGAMDWSRNGKRIATGGMTHFFIEHPKYINLVGPGDYTVKLWEVQVVEHG